MAVGWIQFIDLKCIDRFRNDLIEIASIGAVLRRFSRTPSAAQPALARSAAIAGKAPHKGSSASRLSHYLNDGGIRRTSAVERPTDNTRRESMICRITLALALAITALASIPASASPQHSWQTASNCQEDLGYGRTSSWGCG